MMNTSKLTKTEELCVAYPWKSNVDIEIKKTFKDNYLDYMSNLQIKSNSSQNTLTSIACGVSPDVTRELIENYCERGVSMVVFNVNGLSYQDCRKMVYEINQGVFNYSLNKNDRIPYSLSLVLDLAGSSIMTGTIFKTKSEQSLINLPTNGYIYVTNDIEYKNKCTDIRIYVNCNKILTLGENDSIYLDYGKIELIVKKIDTVEVYCIIKRGGLLGSQKVVHIPNIPIGIKELTEQDEENIRTGVQLKVDVIMIPGVRDAAFFNLVKHFIVQENGDDIDLYAKIDNSIGLEKIDEIISVADGVFLHCPNLSMEIGCDQILLVQKKILCRCIIAGKPTVTYGKFFESMEFNAIPTKAEICDVITSVMDGSDCIYLDVTMQSKHKVHCVEYAMFICRQGESAIWEQQLFTELKNKSKSTIDPIHAMSIGCVEVSLKCRAAAIIVVTTSGLSAKIIARYRPKCPVLAIIVQGKSARKISVWRNVIAVQYKDPVQTVWSKEVENRTKFAMKFAKNKGLLNHGDLVLHMSTSKENAGFTNNMKLFYVGANDFNESSNKNNIN